jgi:hypothetical protein
MITSHSYQTNEGTVASSSIKTYFLLVVIRRCLASFDGPLLLLLRFSIRVVEFALESLLLAESALWITITWLCCVTHGATSRMLGGEREEALRAQA